VLGFERGVQLAIQNLQLRSRPIADLADPILYRIAYTAGREYRDIADLVIAAASYTGQAKLQNERFCFADSVVAIDKAHNEIWQGILLHKKPLHPYEPIPASFHRILVLQDALEPESIEEDALATEAGFRAHMALREQFQAQLEQLLELHIGLIVVDRSIDGEAEQFCADHGIMLLQRLTRTELQKLCEFTGAKPLRRSALRKAPSAFIAALGTAGSMVYDEKLERVRVEQGGGASYVTMIVGASTKEVVGERSRIAMDAASAVQAAYCGGYLPGGGAVEIAVAHELDRSCESMQGMESFGIAAVAQALRKPLAQIVLNAGYNPLEKVEEIKAAQVLMQSDSLGIDCDTGKLMDCLETGIVDPTKVKLYALQAAGEVACAMLRIHTVIKMKTNSVENTDV